MIKVSFSTLGCPGWSLKEIVACASDLGYDGIEIRGIKGTVYSPYVPEFLEENASATMKMLSEKKLEIALFSSGADLSDSLRAAEYLKEAYDYIDLAAMCKVKYVRVLCDANPEQSKPIDIDYLAVRLGSVCERAESKDVQILIETNGYFADSQNMLKLLKRINKKNLGVIWDVHHPYTFMGEEPSFTYSTLKNYIRHVHMKDSVLKDGKIVYKLLGYGSLPITEIVNLLKGGGYDGYISLEWVKRWAAELDDPDIVFPQFIAALKSILNGN